MDARTIFGALYRTRGRKDVVEQIAAEKIRRQVNTSKDKEQKK